MCKAPKANFCMAGIVNDSAQETLPENFSGYSDFTMWVHSQRRVAVRNFSPQSSDSKNHYEVFYSFSNPENKVWLGDIFVQAGGGFPDHLLLGQRGDAGSDGPVAVPANELFLNRSDLDIFAKSNAAGRLVRVGFCETKFVL